MHFNSIIPHIHHSQTQLFFPTPKFLPILLLFFQEQLFSFQELRAMSQRWSHITFFSYFLYYSSLPLPWLQHCYGGPWLAVPKTYLPFFLGPVTVHFPDFFSVRYGHRMIDWSNGLTAVIVISFCVSHYPPSACWIWLLYYDYGRSHMMEVAELEFLKTWN